MMMFIVLSPEGSAKNEISLVNRLFEEGMTHFHLRKPDWTREQLTTYISHIPDEYYSKIVLHSHFDLLDKFLLKGIHLTKKNRKNYNWNLKYRVVSTSFHSMEAIIAAQFKYEYQFLSPIFNSISKPGYRAGFEEKQLIDFLKETKFPIIALGGISKENIEKASKMGFAGVAVLGSIWQSGFPLKAYKELVKQLPIH